MRDLLIFMLNFCFYKGWVRHYSLVETLEKLVEIFLSDMLRKWDVRVDQCTFNYYIRYFGVIMIHRQVLRTVNSLITHEIYYVSDSRVSSFGEFMA